MLQGHCPHVTTRRPPFLTIINSLACLASIPPADPFFFLSFYAATAGTATHLLALIIFFSALAHIPNCSQFFFFFRYLGKDSKTGCSIS
ncbi:hypothetical protein QBC42DRAFT_272595 [Cladorrhinum samala]|uniref:Uncharacterized protein n=1 Tax=Cladorrhinum samala TaxID=585594 RepID=A0AAV9HI08_9PEZI|nr:hypothetical protein QBC42DRAFT_272595 [Cladorrhinum samala]